MKKPRRRRWIWILLLVPAAGLAFLAWPGSSTYTVSPETTYVTEPVDAAGYIDYATALNERLRGTITPEKNANVLIWQAMGPKPEGSRMPPGYFDWLGIEEPPDEGDYFVGYQAFLRNLENQPENPAGLSMSDWGDRLTRRTRWPWSPEDEPEIVEWMRINEKPLAVFVTATQRPEYYNPLWPRHPGLLNALLPAAQKCREVAAMLACRAMLRLHDGRFEDAWLDLLTCHRLGRLLARGGTMIEMLVGIAIDVVASSADLVYLEHAPLTKQQATRCLDDLRQLPPMPSVADKIDLSERFLCLELAMLTARYGVDYLEQVDRPNATPPKDKAFWKRLFTPSIDWDPGLRNINDWYDRCAAAVRMPEYADRQEAIDLLSTELDGLKRQIRQQPLVGRFFYGAQKRGEMIGNILLGLTTPAMRRVVEATDRSQQVHRNLRLAVALVAYRSEKGRYPAMLDDLAPEYLSTVPDDLFTGQPLIYRVEENGYLLYSVGVNGEDEEGRSYYDEPQGDDLVVRMPGRPPRRE